MRFSERIGKKETRTELEKEGVSDELANSLWTLYLEHTLKSKKVSVYTTEKTSEKTRFFRSMWIDFFKRPIDTLINNNYRTEVDFLEANKHVRIWYYGVEWYDKLDFMEFCVNYDNNKFANLYNDYLKRELSAYRFIDGNLTEINSKEEIVEIEQAINNSGKYTSVKSHLKTSLKLLSDLKNPDYRNSIKESISAVEALCKIIIGDNKTTLGQALKVIEKKHKIPKALQSAFGSLYGYTSNEGGIRHSLLEQGVNINVEEARFMLITCSAFINYLISKE